MKISIKTIALTALVASVGATGFMPCAHADDSAAEQVKEAGRDMKKGTKKAIREVKDKTCEMINGKLECTVKKVKHGAENLKDEAADKADDVND